MTRPEQILEAARCIRPELDALIGPDDAPEVDRLLAETIMEANAGQAPNADQRILRLLMEREETMQWVSDYLSEQSPLEVEESHTRSIFQALPGIGAPLPADAFRCPQNDYVWRRRSVGIPIPLCPTHHLPLLPDTEPEAR